MANRVRFYGKTLNVWNHTVNRNGRKMQVAYQTEEAYKEYHLEDGAIAGAGSEDFSPERYKEEVAKYWVWTWDGKKYNKGGKRWFECMGLVKFRKSEKKLVKEYLKMRYPEAELIQLR